jgi:hypothetical protein
MVTHRALPREAAEAPEVRQSEAVAAVDAQTRKATAIRVTVGDIGEPV